MTTRSHHHQHAEMQRGAAHDLPTEAESRLLLAKLFPPYAYWMLTRSEIKLLPAPAIAGLLPAPKPIRQVQCEPVIRGFVTISAVSDLSRVQMICASEDLTHRVCAEQRVTVYGSIQTLSLWTADLRKCGTGISQIHRDLSFPENMMYDYSWKGGQEMRTLRKEFRVKRAAA